MRDILIYKLCEWELIGYCGAIKSIIISKINGKLSGFINMLKILKVEKYIIFPLFLFALNYKLIYNKITFKETIWS